MRFGQTSLNLNQFETGLSSSVNGSCVILTQMSLLTLTITHNYSWLLTITHDYSQLLTTTHTHNYSWSLTITIILITHDHSQLLTITHNYSRLLSYSVTHDYSQLLMTTRGYSWLLTITHYSQSLTITHNYSWLLMIMTQLSSALTSWCGSSCSSQPFSDSPSSLPVHREEDDTHRLLMQISQLTLLGN